MLTFLLPPKVPRNVSDILEQLSAVRSPHGPECVILDGPLMDIKVSLLQVLATSSVGVVD